MSGALVAMLDRIAGRGSAMGLAGSGLLHAALLAALLALAPARSLVAPEPPAISVDLIPPAALVPPAPVPPIAPPARDAPAASAPLAPPLTPSAPAAQPDGSFRATTLYTAGLLHSPQMAQVARALTGIAASERVVQLCNIEALEQIRRAAPQYQPDTLVSYAMSAPVTSGLRLTAPGGAFRSRRQWYRVSLDCVATADLAGVERFSFSLGAPIPQSEWEAHDLNAEDALE